MYLSSSDDANCLAKEELNFKEHGRLLEALWTSHNKCIQELQSGLENPNAAHGTQSVRGTGSHCNCETVAALAFEQMDGTPWRSQRS